MADADASNGNAPPSLRQDEILSYIADISSDLARLAVHADAPEAAMRLLEAQALARLTLERRED